MRKNVLKKYPFSSVSETDFSGWINMINSHYPADIFNEKNSSIDCYSLPFFKDYILCRFETRKTTPFFEAYGLYNAGVFSSSNDKGFKLLNGDVEPLYEVNEQNKLELKEEFLFDYISFFFDFVFPPENKIMLVQDVDDLEFIGTEDKNKYREIEIRTKPISIIEQTSEGWLVSACLFFDEAFYKARLSVTFNGNVDIIDEKKISDDVDIPSEWVK